MPDFVNRLTSCYDLPSCFQMLYNLLLVVLVIMAFMYGVIGALEYLFSAASVTKQESGRNKIINAIGAILVAFILPSILNIINPHIFKVEWMFPGIERARAPSVEVNLSEIETVKIVNPLIPTSGYYWLDCKKGGRFKDYLCCSIVHQIPSSTPNFDAITSYTDSRGISTPVRSIMLPALDCVKIRKNIAITQGYCPYPCATSHQLGLAVDIVPLDGDWQGLANALVTCGFTVLNETTITIDLGGGNTCTTCPLQLCHSTGPHFHAIYQIQAP